jgi:hypothetical protein
MRKEKDSQATPERTSRRRFTKVAAAALFAAPLAASRGGDAQTPATKESTAPPNPQPTPTPAPKPSPVAEAYRGVARARFGPLVTDEEFKRIERDLEGNARTAERLRASRLQNSDEPDFVFSA